MARDLIQWATDQLMLMYTIYEARKIRHLKRTRLQKIAFVSQYNFRETKLDGFTYHFIKLNYGPYSSELKDDLVALERAEVIHESREHGYHIMPYGFQLLDKFQTIADRNREIFDEIRQVTGLIMEAEFETMLESVYQTKNPAHPNWTVGETPKNQYILTREMQEFENPFNITEEEAEALEMALDPEIHRKIRQADKDISEGKISQWKFN